jgi:hypothetical protein
MGLWPTAGTFGVWSERLWQVASTASQGPPVGVAPEVGCDVARFGDDWTVIVARVGHVAVHHEAHNGWDTVRTAARLKDLCQELAVRYDHLPTRIPVKVDDDGVGGGVIDQRGEYHFVPVNAGTAPARPADYPNRRSELWFYTAEKARAGLVALGRLGRDALEQLQRQAMAPVWKLDAAGRRVVEPKAETKKKIGRSPDAMDALNLAFWDAPVALLSSAEAAPRPREDRRGHGLGRR